MNIMLRLPWANDHKPFVAIDIKHWGWALGRGRHRQIFAVVFVWGRLFMDVGGHTSWYPEIPWPRTRDGDPHGS